MACTAGCEEGQWIIVSGEPNNVQGVIKSELAMIAAVREDLHYVDSDGNLLDPDQAATAKTKTALPRRHLPYHPRPGRKIGLYATSATPSPSTAMSSRRRTARRARRCWAAATGDRGTNASP